MFPNVSLPWGEDGCRDPRVLDAAVAHHFGLSLGMVRSLRCFFSFLFHRFSSFNSWTRIHPDVVYVCLYTQTLPRPGYPMNSSRQNQIANGDTTSGIRRFPILRGWNCENCWHVSTVFQVSLSLSDVWAALPRHRWPSWSWRIFCMVTLALKAGEAWKVRECTGCVLF